MQYFENILLVKKIKKKKKQSKYQNFNKKERLGKRFDTTLLFQSIFMIISMLILLEIAVRYRQDHPVLYSELRASFSSSDIDRDLEAEANGYERSTFWHWEHYLNYIITLLVFTTLVALLYLIFHSHLIFIEILGVLSLGIESTLPLPQCISNYRHRSTQGFSLLVLVSWVNHRHKETFHLLYDSSWAMDLNCFTLSLHNHQHNSLLVDQFNYSLTL